MVKAHIGIAENEIADRYAKMGTTREIEEGVKDIPISKKLLKGTWKNGAKRSDVQAKWSIFQRPLTTHTQRNYITKKFVWSEILTGETQ